MLNAKLKRAINLLAISRHYLPLNLLKQIYHGQFYSHLSYGCQIRGQDPNRTMKTAKLKRKAVHINCFANFQADSSPLFKMQKILKLNDIINLNNMTFTHNVLNNNTPNIFKDFFKLKEVRQTHQAISEISSLYRLPAGSLNQPSYKTRVGYNSLKNICSKLWNKMLKILSLNYPSNYTKDSNWLKNCKISFLKHILTKHFLEHY